MGRGEKILRMSLLNLLLLLKLLLLMLLSNNINKRRKEGRKEGREERSGRWIDGLLLSCLLCRETRIVNCKPCETPIDLKHRLDNDEEGATTDKGQYQKLIGKLIYLAHIHPDIVYAMSVKHFGQARNKRSLISSLRESAKDYERIKGWVQCAFKPRGTSNSSLIAAPCWQHQSSSFPLSFALILALYSAVPGLGLSLVQQLQLKANRVQAS
ncbi:hypothetical protein NC651_023726 [Populus alba x Populus x berolinensis]|nr:hypothetical protein NC651_023726 [Populus alba x Populus x berolinensis]